MLQLHTNITSVSTTQIWTLQSIILEILGSNCTFAPANRRSLDLASPRESKCLGLVDVDPERRPSAIEQRAEARRLRLDHARELGAARGRRGGRVSCNVAKARREADDGSRAAS